MDQFLQLFKSREASKCDLVLFFMWHKGLSLALDDRVATYILSTFLESKCRLGHKLYTENSAWMLYWMLNTENCILEQNLLIYFNFFEESLFCLYIHTGFNCYEIIAPHFRTRFCNILQINKQAGLMSSHTVFKDPHQWSQCPAENIKIKKTDLFMITVSLLVNAFHQRVSN